MAISTDTGGMAGMAGMEGMRRMEGMVTAAAVETIAILCLQFRVAT